MPWSDLKHIRLNWELDQIRILYFFVWSTRTTRSDHSDEIVLGWMLLGAPNSIAAAPNIFN